MRRRAPLLLLAVALVLSLPVLATTGCRSCVPERDSGPERQPAVWPLTGEEAPDENAVRQRVVSVKIENLPAARPQTGLSSADVVYETLTEGGITRFNCLFHSDLPESVGPVRSARFSDIYIVPQYNALFAYSGANRRVLASIEEAGLPDMGANEAPELYSRTDRPAPHNLYLDLPGVRETAPDKGFEAEADPPRLRFGDAPATEDRASEVTVPFRPENRVSWTWNAEANAYERAINGEPHAGTESAGPITASNVIVMFAEETGGERPGTLDIRLAGSGAAIVMRGGMRYEARWTADEGSPPRFELEAGGELPLATGRTWIEVVPQGLEVEVR